MVRMISDERTSDRVPTRHRSLIDSDYCVAGFTIIIIVPRDTLDRIKNYQGHIWVLISLQR